MEQAEQAQAAVIKLEVNTDILENGETFDEDSGEYLGKLSYTVQLGEVTKEVMKLPPATISIYIDGFWYQYKMNSKVEAKETNNVQEKAS